MARIALVNPAFERSFWGFDHVMGITGKGAIVPFAALPLLAALTPPSHTVELFDARIAPLDYDYLAKFDIVGLTGLSVQRHQMIEIATELKKRGAFLVIGGGWVTVKEDYFDGLADVVFVGEADTTWPRFLDEWARGTHARRYKQTEATDMTTLPVPRNELLPMDRYMFASLQISRGCPYRCEFCDIIVTFGRRPRLKTPEQVIAELENMQRHGQRGIFIVDDNLIGNRKAVKPILEAIVAWQREREFPVRFFTEASLDLAEEPALLKLLVEANVQAVFVGVESPNDAALAEIKKTQNVMGEKRRSIIDRVHTIQDAGIEVWCGMIVGFDADDRTVFEDHRRFLRESHVPWAMIGMLAAFPTTPLYERLDAAGRIDHDDHPSFGTNVIPARMSRQELTDGYRELLLDTYDPDNYFARVDGLHIERGHDHGIPGRNPFIRKRTRAMRAARELVKAVVAYKRLMEHSKDDALKARYRKQIAKMIATAPHPAVLSSYVFKCVAHHHHWTLSREIAGESTTINTF